GDDTMRRAIALLIATTVATIGLAAGVPSARAQNADNAAVAVNTRDDALVFDLMFAIRRAMGDSVDSANVAFVYASCSSCETVAIAVETVLVMSDPTVVEPLNLAYVDNYHCTDCQSLADAYQWVLGTGGPVYFTPEGSRELAQIRRELEALRTSGLD